MTLWIFLLCLAAVLQQPARCMRADQPKEIVNKHNDLRRKVRPTASNMLRMKWNPEAAKNSQHWAERCIFSHSPPDRHIVNGKQCGENLYMSSQPTLWSKVIDSWYGEEKYFKYGVGAVRPGAVVGHYTQVVWYKSYEIGCYSAFCPNRNYKHFYVCQYCPAGNIVGSLKTPYKSGPPCGDCPSACDNGLCTNPCKYTNKYSNCKELTDRFGCTPELEGDCAATCRCTTEIK